MELHLPLSEENSKRTKTFVTVRTCFLFSSVALLIWVGVKVENPAYLPASNEFSQQFTFPRLGNNMSQSTSDTERVGVEPAIHNFPSMPKQPNTSGTAVEDERRYNEQKTSVRSDNLEGLEPLESNTQVPKPLLQNSTNLTMQTVSGWRKPESENGDFKKRYPTCIIFGVSKCGTRALVNFILLHPDVVGPNDEVNYFDRPKRRKDLGLGWYLDQMPRSYPNQTIIEKSPDYFQSMEAPELIHRVNRNVKLILIIRDPVERLISQFMQYKAIPGNPHGSFEKWVYDERNGKFNEWLFDVNFYAKHLKRWYQVFPKDQIYIVESVEFTKNPAAVLKRLEKFLNLKPYFSDDDFYYDPQKGFYCVSTREGRGVVGCLDSDKGRKHDKVDRKMLEKLYEYHYPLNQEFFKLINQTFDWHLQ